MKKVPVRLEVIYDYRLTNLPDVVIVEISAEDIERWEAIALIVADNGLEDASLYEDRCTFFKLAEGADRDDQGADIEAFDFCPHGESVVITANGVSWKGLAADEPLSSSWFTYQESFKDLRKKLA